MTLQETKQSETKEEEKKEPAKAPVMEFAPTSVKNDPKRWDEALNFATMLTHRRPHGSKTERGFIGQYLIPLGVKFDKKGNVYKTIGKDPVVLWSCHTDTVHSKSGHQKVVYWPEKNGDVFFGVGQDNKNHSSCLGADDTCGIWLMIEMIKAKIPGLYIFHRAEEVGGLGSKFVSENNKEALAGIKFAIAFDRRDEKSIITFQRGKRCCSNEFAESLAAQLGMGHKCDTTGAFTDTANYTDLIGECTNISVGYDGAHSSVESTNVDYLFRLRDAILKIDVTKLVEKRKAGEYESSYSNYGRSYGGYYGGYHGWGDWDQYGWYKDVNNVWRRKEVEKKERNKDDGFTGIQLRDKYPKGDWFDDYEYEDGLWYKKEKKTQSNYKPYRHTPSGTSYSDALRMVKLNPEVIVEILESLGYRPKDIKDELMDYAKRTNRTIYL